MKSVGLCEKLSQKIIKARRAANITNEFITQYLPLVKRIGLDLFYHLPAEIQLDDLIQTGLMGLLEARQHYDPAKGASFETYAAIRIKGYMLDEVRRENWLPRSVNQHLRRITAAAHELENKLGRPPHDAEMAAELHLSAAEYHTILQTISATQLTDWDELHEVSTNYSNTDNHFSSLNADPFEGLALQNFYQSFIQAFEKLSPKEKMVIFLYYQQDLNLKQIGKLLHVSESRACQIHNQAMQHLHNQCSNLD